MVSAKTRRPTVIAVMAAMLVGFAAPVWATTVLVDIGNDASYRGASVVSPDGNGNHWNSVWSGAYYPDMVDITGAATAIDLGFSSAGGTDYYNGPSGDIPVPAASVYNAAALGNLGVDEAVYDYYTNSTIEIQGLDPSKTYNLTFYGSHKYHTPSTTVYSIYSDNTYTTLVDSVTLDVNEAGQEWLHNEDTVATLTGLSPQALDILYLKFEGLGGGDGYLNAMQIDEVPEPTSLLLLMGGMSMVGLSRRRKG